jgi:maintenance of morphology protein 1
MEKSVEDAVQLANGEFIKGFISGQIILCILIFFLLKVFLLRNSTETRSSLNTKRSIKVRSVTVQQKHVIDSIILDKLKYDIQTQPNEQCNWLNILLAQMISTLRNDSSILAGLASKLDTLMNQDDQKRPSFIGPIHITNLQLGEEFPEFRNCRVGFSESEGNMRVLMDFAFDDQITLSIDSQALVNWPRPGMASLPVSLTFTLVKFSGTVLFDLYSS